MSRRTRRLAAAAATTLLTTLPLVALTAPEASAGQPAGFGPSDPFDDALMGNDGPVEPMKNQAKIERTRYGYLLIGGQQDNHVTITAAGDTLRFRDTHSGSWKSLASSCRAQRVSTGVAAVCRAPSTTSLRNPTLLEIHPRLGDDYIDGRNLPASFEMAALVDAGRDTVFGGHGNDFINGAMDVDRIHGGAGRDWIRGGGASDRIWGNTGADYIVGQDGADAISGGPGTDRIYG